MMNRQKIIFPIMLSFLFGCFNCADDAQHCDKTVEPNKDIDRPGLPAGEGEGIKTHPDSHHLKLGEEYSLYDFMGPLVINEDGSTRRISNWIEMTDRERENTLRVLARRNKIRLENLRAARELVRTMASVSEIIPDVVEDVADSVQPQFRLHFDSISDQEWTEGTEMTPASALKQPLVSWSAPAAQGQRDQLWTIVMVDPDAPTRKSPQFRNWLHWLVINARGNCNSTICLLERFCGSKEHAVLGEEDAKLCGTTLATYAGPSPPPGSGLHRYVALLYKQDTVIDRASLPTNFESRRSGFHPKSLPLDRPNGVTYFVSRR